MLTGLFYLNMKNNLFDLALSVEGVSVHDVEVRENVLENAVSVSQTKTNFSNL